MTPSLLYYVYMKGYKREPEMDFVLCNYNFFCILYTGYKV